MFRILHWLDELIHQFFAVVSRGVETLEYVFNRICSALLFDRRHQRDLPAEDSSRNTGPGLESWTDFCESYFERFLSLVRRLVMPWRWFRSAPPNESAVAEGGPEGSLDFFEWYFDRVLRIVGPWRWLRKPLTPESDDTGVGAGLSGADSFESGFERISLMIVRVFLPHRWFRPLADVRDLELTPEDSNGFFSRFVARLRLVEYLLTCATIDAVDFVGEWWYSRDKRRLIGAMPAALMSVPLMALIVLIPLYSADSKIKHYRTALLNASQASDKDSERLYMKKLELLGYQRQDRAEYRRAIAVAREEKYEQAYEIMKTIAPRDEPGYLNAHLWIAGALMQELIEDDNPWETIALHAEHAAALNAYDPAVQRLQVELHLHHGRGQEAMRVMEAAVSSYPSYHAALMHHSRRQGETLEARRHAKRAIDFFESSVADDISLLGFLRWAESHEVLGQPAAELRVLKEASERYPRDPYIERALTFAANRRLQDVSLEDVNAELALRQVLEVAPRHDGAWQRILDGFASDPTRTEAIVERLVGESMPASFHKLLGDVFFQRENYRRALECYESTCRVNPHAATAWNNAAWILGNVEPMDLERALEAANRAITHQQDPRFYETRGQLYMKLGRWDAAISDLERAINGQVPDLAAAHQSLAEAYDRKGNIELALAHRSMADGFAEDTREQ